MSNTCAQGNREGLTRSSRASRLMCSGPRLRCTLAFWVSPTFGRKTLRQTYIHISRYYYATGYLIPVGDWKTRNNVSNADGNRNVSIIEASATLPINHWRLQKHPFNATMKPAEQTILHLAERYWFRQMIRHLWDFHKLVFILKYIWYIDKSNDVHPRGPSVLQMSQRKTTCLTQVAQHITSWLEIPS